MILSAIAAMSENRVIGIDNKLPWRVPEDLKWFKDKTRGKTVIMGRKTFESLGKPLPNRRNIVLTRSPDFSADGIEILSSLEEALALVRKSSRSDEEVFIIGGSQIYEQSLGTIDRLYLTIIHKHFDGDSYFPEVDFENNFSIQSKTESSQTEPQALKYTFIIAERQGL